MEKKFIEEKIFKGLMLLATGIILISLFLILASILIKGLPSISLDMITKTSADGDFNGEGGGVLNAILGSLYLAAGATTFAFFFSLPVALYMNVYRTKYSSLVNFTRLCLEVLWGIPSIVYGAFAFIIMLYFGVRASLFAGTLTVGVLVIPIMIRSMDEVIRTVPKGLLDASYSLGATSWETAFTVVVKQTLPGIITAVLLSFGRAIGDAASVMLTAGYTNRIPESLFHKTATLPLAIFFELGSPFKEVQNRAYASALILTVMILIISIASRAITKRYLKNKL
jgi:phosphate transport system permease protein